MKINNTTQITGSKVILVPYKEHHVLRYHEWMKCEELQQLTASEPLSLEDEYKMQKSWFEDEDKCTFIILNRLKFQEKSNEIDSMIGDTNLFFDNSEKEKIAEIEIMIAEKIDRGKGCGREATILMLIYGIEKLGVQKYSAKISIENVKSCNMFQKLDFIEISRSSVFKEVTLEKNVDCTWLNWLRSNVKFEMNENYDSRLNCTLNKTKNFE
ncbi:N-acetyltransferase 9-like protein [Trichogramma pretiosum]|uniref:N-acetyltransferase 9-like protein n=1 Tax=Trichogramma pretiosum TaxID=7493 RepID=UPI000C718FC9|nr:N-acetyltransferase 9-like protein [Trichogramma pretiosum]